MPESPVRTHGSLAHALLPPLCQGAGGINVELEHLALLRNFLQVRKCCFYVLRTVRRLSLHAHWWQPVLHIPWPAVSGSLQAHVAYVYQHPERNTRGSGRAQAARCCKEIASHAWQLTLTGKGMT